MSSRKKKVNEDQRPDPGRLVRRPKGPTVIVRVQSMDAEQERRFSTATDALLAELVRQEMGRARQL